MSDGFLHFFLQFLIERPTAIRVFERQAGSRLVFKIVIHRHFQKHPQKDAYGMNVFRKLKNLQLLVDTAYLPGGNRQLA